MKIIFKQLKPFTLMVIISLCLLFTQAVCELYLPNLMSDIVNVGIQKSGIEETAPKQISENGMSLVSLFMSDDNGKKFASAYEKQEGKYVLKAEVVSDAEKMSETGDIYGGASASFVNFFSSYAKQMGVSMESAEGESGFADVDMNTLYSILPMLEAMPKDQLVDQNVSDANTSYIGSQVGTVLTKLFYEELGVDTAKIQSSYIFKVGLKMVGVALLGMALSIGVAFLSSKIGSGVSRSLRRDVFTKVEGFTNNEFDKFSTASLITRTTNDVQQVQMLVTMGLRLMCFAPIMGIGGIVMALQKSTSLSWIIGIAVLIIMGIILILLAVAMPKFTMLQKLIDKLNLVSRENLSGIMVIRAFGNEQYEEGRFEGANKELADTNRFVLRAMSMLQPAMMLIMNGVVVAIIWVGAKAIANSTLQIGDMLAFMQYAMHIIMSFLMIALMFIMVPRAAVSAKRISEVLDTEYSIKEPTSAKTLNKKKDTGCTVEFSNVSFMYEKASEEVLSDITFTAKPGETTAVIGSTGSGKSTLVNLILRFYDVTKGKIKIDGKDIRELDTKELRETIGYVPQKGVLFSGSVEDNVKYGKADASSYEVMEAIDTAQASDFVNELEGKTDYEIAQGGDNVSGGQKQRLAIARALVKKAPIYIFDDSFSALDFKTDANLRRALEKKTGNSTLIIVAQRVGTIMNAEQIIVLDNGKIVGKGTHKELLQSCATYREIAESQLSKEELQ